MTWRSRIVSAVARATLTLSSRPERATCAPQPAR
jgi:hypothetical protein